MPGAPELPPVKLGSSNIFGGCVSKGSMGSKFVAKYILLMGQSKDKGLNSVDANRKSLETPSTKAVDRLAILFCILT